MVCCHTSLCLYLECPLLARQASLWRAYAGRRLARCPTKLHDFILHMLFRANNDSQAVSVTSLIILFLCMYFLSNNDSQAVSVTSLIILCMYFVFSILAHVDVILPPSVFFDVEMAPVEASVAASVAAGAAGDAPDASSAAPPSALVQQLSFYFSDANLRRDRFLLNHTGQNAVWARWPSPPSPPSTASRR